MAKLFANSGDPNQMPHSAAFDLGLHCLPITLLGVSSLQWVKDRQTDSRFLVLPGPRGHRKAPEKSALRKHAYSNILKILPPKNENFQIKILIYFNISAQNIDCGYSLEPP